jgi:hypothetical protein
MHKVAEIAPILRFQGIVFLGKVPTLVVGNVLAAALLLEVGNGQVSSSSVTHRQAQIQAVSFRIQQNFIDWLNFSSYETR